VQSRRLLGEFELLSELGRGGMGVVYRAWQPSLGRQVALKCLSRAGDPKAEARFRREIRALGHVEHPHLVKVFTSGADGDQWFYVMELVEGATLAAVCDRLSARSSARDVNADTWQAVFDTACAEARRAEKPLSDGPAPEVMASRGVSPRPLPRRLTPPARRAGRPAAVTSGTSPGWCARWRRRRTPCTRRGWSTATSSRATSWWRPAAARRCSWTWGWRSWPTTSRAG
jgi:hypothetical protein